MTDPNHQGGTRLGKGRHHNVTGADTKVFHGAAHGFLRHHRIGMTNGDPRKVGRKCIPSSGIALEGTTLMVSFQHRPHGLA